MRGLFGSRVMVVMWLVCTGRQPGVAQHDRRTAVDGGQHETSGNEGAKE
jgi:hypothetical protein